MKPKLIVTLLFIVSASGWLYGMEDKKQPVLVLDENNKDSSLVDCVCSYFGFGDDTYGEEYDEEKYKKKIALRFKKAKICLVSGTPLLLCGAVTLEKTTGSCNPLKLFVGNDSGSFEKCNAKLNHHLHMLTRFVTHPDSGKDMVNLSNLHKEACEAQFPQTKTFDFSHKLRDNLSVYSALGMMARGCFLVVSGLVHLGSGLFAVCHMGYCSVFKKSDCKKID